MKASLKRWMTKVSEDICNLSKDDYVVLSLNSTYISSGEIVLHKVGGTVTVQVDALTLRAYSGRQTIATLPIGYRPKIREVYARNASGKAVMLHPDGTVQVDGTGAVASFGYSTTAYTVVGGVARNLLKALQSLTYKEVIA